MSRHKKHKIMPEVIPAEEPKPQQVEKSGVRGDFLSWRRFGFSIILFVSFLGIYFRLYPVTYNKELRQMNNAKMIVYVNLSNTVRQDIERMFPGLTEVEKIELQTKRLKEVIDKDKKEIDNLIRITAVQQAANALGQNEYLLEADPYYYLGLTKNLIRQGNIGGPIKGIKYYNPLMMAPGGFWYNFDLHPFVGYYLYRILSLADKNISVETAVSIVPLFLFLLSVLVFFWLYRILELDKFSLALGMIYFVCFPGLIVRNSYGWYDTDIYNCIFPALIVAGVLKSFSYRNNFRKQIIWILLSSFFTALYGLFWRGWIYLPLFLVLVFLLMILINLILRTNAKKMFVLTLSYLGGILFFIFIFVGLSGLKQSYEESMSLVRAFLNLTEQVWPDVYITIGELKTPDLKTVLSYWGGLIVVLVSFIGLLDSLFFLFRQRQDGHYRMRDMFVIMISLFLLIFSLSAERFLLFSLVPLGIFFPLGIRYLCRIFQRLYLSTAKKIRAPQFLVRYSHLIIRALLIFSVLTVIFTAHGSASTQFPIMNDVWYKVLVQIRDSTPADSIINSWWCPGHFITGISQRRVIFDGATQNMPQGYWIARAFASKSERECLGILRMLDSSGNAAFDFLNKEGLRTSQAIALLNAILPLSKKEALSRLLDVLPKEKAEGLIEMTHGMVPPAYCFIYNNWIDTIVTLKYFSNWNFKKMEEFNQLKKENQTDLGGITRRGSDRYRDFLWSMSGGQPYIENESYENYRRDNTVFFANGVSVNLNNMDCLMVSSAQAVSAKPASIFYMDGDNFKEKTFSDSTVNLSILLIKRQDKYSSIILDKQLAESIILRLYYLEGQGLRYFEKFTQADDALTQTRIYVFKINWDKFLSEDN